MKESVIAFDIDGVLADTYNSVNKLIKEKYNFDTKGTVRNHEIKVPGVPYEEVLEVVYSVLADVNAVDPYTEALEYLPKIYNMLGKHVTFLSARNERFYGVTKDWLKKHFPSIKNSKLILERSSFKHKYLESKRIRFMVDDRIKVVNSLSSNMIGFLVNREWNQNREINHNIIRVNSLKEVYKIVRRKHIV